MGLIIRISPRVTADLEQIRAYLSARSPQGAERVRQRIEQTVDTLSDYPGIGRLTNIADIKMIAVVHYPYLVYHTVTDDELVIVHIRHASRAAPTQGEF